MTDPLILTRAKSRLMQMIRESSGTEFETRQIKELSYAIAIEEAQVLKEDRP